MTERKWRVSPENVRKVMQFIWSQVKDISEPMELILRPAKSKRTEEQLRRQWALYRQVAAVVWLPNSETGEMQQFSPEAWHELFARMFIGVEELPDGSVKALSTARLSVEVFGEYMTQIEAWCAEQGYQVMEAA